MKTMWIVCALLSFALFGCRDGEGPPGKDGAPGAQGPAGERGAPGRSGKDSDEPGKRLTPRHILGEDGSRLRTADMFDETTEQRCAYEAATDGALRCLPDKINTEIGVARVYFLDAACAKPIFSYYQEEGTPTPPVFGRALILPDEVYVKVGAATADPATLYSFDAAHVCTLINGYDGEPLYFYEVDILEADFFVAGEVAAD